MNLDEIETAYKNLLDEVSQSMIDRFYSDFTGNIEPSREQIAEFERAFNNDPYRQSIIKRLVEVKALNPKPIYLVNTPQEN